MKACAAAGSVNRSKMYWISDSMISSLQHL